MAKQLEAFRLHKVARREGRRDVEYKVFDKRALGNPPGVIEATDVVRGPLDEFDQRSKVTRNLRGDTLAQLRDRRQIDEHQYHAGREWQGLYEAASIGALKAADTTKEPVDGGGGVTDPLTDRQSQALKRLAVVDKDLGLEGAYLMRDVLGTGMTIQDAAAWRGKTSSRTNDPKFWGKRFRECLETLAVSFGYAMKPR